MTLELAELQLLSVAALSLVLGVFLGAFTTAIIKRPKPSVGKHRVRRRSYSPSAKGYLV